MSRVYSSQNGALQVGLFYAGRFDICKEEIKDLIDNGKVRVVDQTISQFSTEAENCQCIEFENQSGMVVQMASCSFRDGFDLWTINKDNGMSFRLS
jgi:predicted secreted protein